MPDAIARDAVKAVANAWAISLDRARLEAWNAAIEAAVKIAKESDDGPIGTSLQILALLKTDPEHEHLEEP